MVRANVSAINKIVAPSKALCIIRGRCFGPPINRAICGAANPKKEIVPTVLTAAPINIAKAISAIRRTLRGSIPRCFAVASPNESKSKLGAIQRAIAIPTMVKIKSGSKSLEFVNASEPKLQNEIDLASDREMAVVRIPTIAEIVAENANPIMIELPQD